MVKFGRSDSVEKGFQDVYAEQVTVFKGGSLQVTTLKGGLLRKPAVLTTLKLPVMGNDIEFVQVHKGEQWLVQAATGPMGRQAGLQRTKMVEDLAHAACTKAHACLVSPNPITPAAIAACGRVHDPARDFSLDDDDEDIALAMAGSAENERTPKERKRDYARHVVVIVDMPARALEMYPECKDTHKVTCLVENFPSRQVWISVEDVPWLVRALHDQATLGGVPLLDDQDPCDRGELSTLGAGSCAKVRWDFFTSSWMALGRRLKPADVTPQEVAETDFKLPRDWEDLSWADKKDIAYTVMERWVEKTLLDSAK